MVREGFFEEASCGKVLKGGAGTNHTDIQTSMSRKRDHK
jgi:hypothetical protein